MSLVGYEGELVGTLLSQPHGGGYMGEVWCICVLQVWMLTGDKLETAASIAVSSRLVSRAQTLFTFKQVSSPKQTSVLG